jgi:hypothetical protein
MQTPVSVESGRRFCMHGPIDVFRLRQSRIHKPNSNAPRFLVNDNPPNANAWPYSQGGVVLQTQIAADNNSGSSVWCRWPHQRQPQQPNLAATVVASSLRDSTSLRSALKKNFKKGTINVRALDRRAMIWVRRLNSVITATRDAFRTQDILSHRDLLMGSRIHNKRLLMDPRGVPTRALELGRQPLEDPIRVQSSLRG